MLPITRILFVTFTCLISNSAISEQHILTKKFLSEAVARDMSYKAVLPDGYDPSHRKRYPVIYMLHGRGGNLNTWNNPVFLKSVRNYEIIFIFPDVGSSWYINWSKSNDGEKNDWEDYICNDLISHVDKNFKTIPKRSGRALNGSSMGGFGSLYLGLKRPELFCSINCGSGGLEFIDSYRAFLRGERSDLQAKKSITEEGTLKGLWPNGRLFTSLEDCDKADPFLLIEKVPKSQLPDIRLSIGFGENKLLDYSIAFSKKLIELEIPFTIAFAEGFHGMTEALEASKMAILHQNKILTDNIKMKKK